MEDGHHDFIPFEGDLPSIDDLPPEPPIPPREPPRRGPAPRSVFWFAPWFFGIAALVAVERLSMLLVSSPDLGVHVQLAGFAVFCTIVFSVTLFGGFAFARSFRLANPSPRK